MTLIHPYNDELVMTGQGSVELEMLADNPELVAARRAYWRRRLDIGIAIAARDIKPNRIIGVEANYGQP